MYMREIILVCFCFFSSKITEAQNIDGQGKSMDSLSRLIRLISDDFPDRTVNKGQTSKENLQKNQRFEEQIKENNYKQQLISPVAQYILRRLMQGTDNSGLLPRDNEMSRGVRADHVIGVNLRDYTFPWDMECSGGYNHCGGYFPLCCDRFVCLKPLTPWDIKHGFKRCWPHYFQEDGELEKENEN